MTNLTEQQIKDQEFLFFYVNAEIIAQRGIVLEDLNSLINLFDINAATETVILEGLNSLENKLVGSVEFIAQAIIDHRNNNSVKSDTKVDTILDVVNNIQRILTYNSFIMQDTILDGLSVDEAVASCKKNLKIVFDCSRETIGSLTQIAIWNKKFESGEEDE